VVEGSKVGFIGVKGSGGLEGGHTRDEALLEGIRLVRWDGRCASFILLESSGTHMKL
jgi:hypothetical protein